MNRSWQAVIGLALLGALLAFSLSARADHMQTQRSSGQRNNGARADMTVPYLTTGKTTFMPNYVQPKIYSSPIVDDPAHPQSKPVFNLIFYGSKQSFGDASNGASPRTKGLPR
jgi:hypothetical protein